MIIFLSVLGALLLFVAVYVLRGVYYIRKAKRLEAEVAELEAQTEVDQAEAARVVVARGFVPGEELNTELAAPPTADRTAAVAAVEAGDWAAGAAWIEAAGQNWDERWERIRALAEIAAEDDAWLLEWRAARPGDPVAAQVHADASVLVAWNVRGDKRASHTTQEQFRVFHQLLAKAQEAAHEAARLADPADPLPYMIEQPMAMGLGYSHERYEQLWAEITKRTTTSLGPYTGALQYWCAKWRGSHERAEAFALAAAAQGAPGQLLSMLPLYAYFEQEQHENDIDPDVWLKEPKIVAAVDAALADVAAAAPDDPRTVRVRHLLAWFLYWQDRYQEAEEQFRLIDGWIGHAPWTYSSDPKDRYLNVRDYTVRQVHGTD
ncbi:hypothetical protein [Streptomyces sp. NPDC047981]|uniref:hypothetical protein n=1 Tax=Streptomyces sp. NPDC047981 TaxID=3154610 RepID=UPI00342C869B